jgi:ABC-type transport system involved in multi-copper enzyme maturation permease subunit
VSAIISRLPVGRLPRLRPHFGSGIGAIVVKELRGRMRGRRAFIIITIHVLLLALFGWMFMRMNEEQAVGLNYGGEVNFASAAIGRGIFLGLMMVQTLMVAVLAPAATAGAISSEREHQTLELLAVTPISSLAIVFGKLISALAWVFVLILASIPVTALVFVFGGVAPDDMLRGYVVLFATVIGLGSVGIFFSTLTRRTGASTGLTFVAVLALVVGSFFVWMFLSNTAQTDNTGLRRQPPEALLYLNPFAAQMDVMCGTEDGGIGQSCSLITGIVGPQVVPDFPRPQPFEPPALDGGGVGGANAGGGEIFVPGGNLTAEELAKIRAAGGVVGQDDEITEAQLAISWRDRFWPKSVLAFLFLATVMTLASVQFVTPTRRWRPSLPGPVRRLISRRSA